MNGMRRLAAILLITVSGTAGAEQPPDSWDGLIAVKPKRMDAVYLLPGADFRPYTKLMVDPTEVAFRKDWMKDMNQASATLSHRVTQEDAAEILEVARSSFADIFHEAFTKAGYEVVTTPGEDVLRVETAVINLYLNAPDPMSAGRSRSYTANAGEATLIIEVRDSTTNAVLGRVVDRRETTDYGTMRLASSVSNLADFKRLFGQWADTTVNGLQELKAHSPVPQDLKPKQKL